MIFLVCRLWRTKSIVSVRMYDIRGLSGGDVQSSIAVATVTILPPKKMKDETNGRKDPHHS